MKNVARGLLALAVTAETSQHFLLILRTMICCSIIFLGPHTCNKYLQQKFNKLLQYLDEGIMRPIWPRISFVAIKMHHLFVAF